MAEEEKNATGTPAVSEADVQNTPVQPDTPASTEPDSADQANTSAEQPAASEQQEIRDPVAYAKAQEEKFQRLLSKREQELEAKNAEYAKLEARLKSFESEQTEQLRQELAALKQADEERTAELASAKLTAMRAKVGAAAGLPAELIDRLQGDTEDAIKEDAERLAALIPKAEQRPSPALGNRASGGNNAPQWRNHGRGGFGDGGVTISGDQ